MENNSQDMPQDTQPIDDQWGEALKESAGAQAVKHSDAAKPAQFDALNQENGGMVANIGMILDIPVTVSVEIGRTKMVVRDLLQLGQGAVVELEKLAGDPMEILVNGKLVARGEAVVVNDKFGVKLTDIVSLTERINKLK
ncbi:MAG: flagellar motor switch protein FliN [Deltaproteobacteria bacterium]|nr:flagellar motor switch protein FliN [Deltaproteobacteria bacterium]